MHNHEEKVQGCVFANTDITERKRAEKEKEKLQEQLIQSEKMAGIGTLAGSIAHEFNNLLQIMRGHTEFAQKSKKPEDILLLVPHFLKKYTKKGKPKEISSEAMKALMSYDWPGNVRELENMIYRTIVLIEGDTIESSHLPLELQNLAQPKISSNKNAISLEDPSSHEIIPFEEIEKEVLSHALKVSDGNISKATRGLGIGRATFYRKLKKYNLIDKNLESN